MPNYKQMYENHLSQLKEGGNLRWHMSVGNGDVLHIPVGSVFSFGESSPYLMSGLGKAVKNKENQEVIGKWRFDSVNRNILHFSKYPPRLDAYGVLNHSVVFGGESDEVDFQATGRLTESIPLKKLGRDGDWLSHIMTVEAAPPMGVLPVGTIIKFGKGLVDNDDLIMSLRKHWDDDEDLEGLESSARAIVELFREKYKTNAFGQHLVKGEGQWIITANAGVNAQGLVRNKNGKIKRFYSSPYTLRRVKSVGEVTEDRPKVGYGELELYTENESNRIDLRADTLHELLWLTARHITHEIKKVYDVRNPSALSYEDYCPEMDMLYEGVCKDALTFAVSINPLIFHPFHLEKIMSKTDGRWGHGLGLHTRKTFVDTGGWKGSGPSFLPAGMAQANYWVADSDLPYILKPIYLSIPVTVDVSGSGEPYCLDKTSSILSPFEGIVVKNYLEGWDAENREQYESLRIPIIWYIQRWLWNKPSYGGPVWANYQGSSEYKKTILDDESWALEGMDTNIQAGASSNPRFQFATTTYNLVGKQYQ